MAHNRMKQPPFPPAVMALLDRGPYLTIAQAAAQFGLRTSTLRRYVMIGRMPSRRLRVDDLPPALWEGLSQFARGKAWQHGGMVVITAAVMKWYFGDRQPGRRLRRAITPPRASR